MDEKVDALMIAPLWENQVWYPILYSSQSYTKEPYQDADQVLEEQSLHMLAWKQWGYSWC